MEPVYIYDAVRTPRGRGLAASENRPGGGLAHLAPQELVRQLIAALDQRADAPVTARVGHFLLACVGQVGAQGGHIALLARLVSGLPDHCAAVSLNNYCAGGLSAVNHGAAWSLAQPDQLVLAGGVEMLSAVPFLADRAAWYNDPDLRDRLDWTPAAMGAELMAWREGYDRADLDAVTIRSHGRAAAAWRDGRFNTGVVPVLNPSGDIALARDEWVRDPLDPLRLAGLAPLFGDDAASRAARAVIARRFPELAGRDPVMTSAHVPGFTDGAALVLLGSARAGERAGLKPRARIRSMAERGGDAVDQFQAGFDAMDAALAQAGLGLDQVDLIEFMEAFAAPPLRFERTRAPDMDRVNVNGGHLAMGHPMGATGAVLTGMLLDELERRGGETGLVVTLGAGGVGSALIIDRA